MVRSWICLSNVLIVVCVHNGMPFRLLSQNSQRRLFHPHQHTSFTLLFLHAARPARTNKYKAPLFSQRAYLESNLDLASSACVVQRQIFMLFCQRALREEKHVAAIALSARSARTVFMLLRLRAQHEEKFYVAFQCKCAWDF